MASEPKVGDHEWQEGVKLHRMWLGDGWHYVGNEATRVRLSALLSAAQEMREMLKELQWSATWQHEDEDYREADECPECECRKHEGHAPDCRLARLIGGGE